MSLNEEVFDVLYKNLVEVKPEYSNKNIILCPICLSEITKSEVMLNGIEHIIPKNSIKMDSTDKKSLGTLNQRCGITVLCRQERVCKSNGTTSIDGCNGLKGSLYDRLWKPYWNNQKIDPEKLTHRHGVSILVMAYLGAFQRYGYDYILQTEFDEIREQFDFPDERITNWLEFAQVYLEAGSDNIISTARAHPFVTGGILSKGCCLEVLFRRFKAYLPTGHWQVKTVVNALTTILPTRR